MIEMDVRVDYEMYCSLKEIEKQYKEIHEILMNTKGILMDIEQKINRLQVEQEQKGIRPPVGLGTIGEVLEELQKKTDDLGSGYLTNIYWHMGTIREKIVKILSKEYLEEDPKKENASKQGGD